MELEEHYKKMNELKSHEIKNNKKEKEKENNSSINNINKNKIIIIIKMIYLVHQ